MDPHLYKCDVIGCGYRWTGPLFEHDVAMRRHQLTRHEAIVEAEEILAGTVLPAARLERPVGCSCLIAEVHDPDCNLHGEHAWRWR